MGLYFCYSTEANNDYKIIYYVLWFTWVVLENSLFGDDFPIPDQILDVSSSKLTRDLGLYHWKKPKKNS